MNEFKIPPVSPLIGSTIRSYFKVLGKGHIAKKYYFKIFLTGLIVLIATPFHIWEELVFRRRIKEFKFKKPPLFILGHWRSGTTFLHNMLSKDPSAGYITTYQSVFPNNLASKWIFRPFMKLKMPKKRPSDNVVLHHAHPQEDGFAFSNMQWNAYYNFFYFPSKYKTFYEKGIYHKKLRDKEIDLWYHTYDKLLKKAAINTKGERLIVKNPVNTARIEKILRLYPDAKFLFIYRNPITVFLSTQRFFQQLFPTICLEQTDYSFIDKLIFDVYKRLMEDYLEQKSLIPAGNLMELKFEKFELAPLKELEQIYSKLLNEDFSTIKHYFSDYLNTLKNYKKNKYMVDEKLISAIHENLGKYIAMYNYKLPDNVPVRARI